MTEKKPEIFKGGGSLKILLRTQKTFHRPLMSNNNIIHYIHTVVPLQALPIGMTAMSGFPCIGTLPPTVHYHTFFFPMI